MTDEPDGNRTDDPSDSTSEEDPFIYPADEADADVDAVAEDEGETATDADPESTGGDATGGTASTEPASSPSARDATSSRTGAASRSSPGSTTGGSSSDAGAHVTDRRSHASGSSQRHSSRDGTAREGRARQGRGGHPTESGPSGIGGWIRWFWTTDEGVAIYVRDVVTSIVAVLVVGLVLFAISGIWPPMVAVESGSMEPNMQVGDLVFIVDNERYTPEGAQEYRDGSTGVVPADRATESGRSKFGGPGDVIVFRPNGREGTTPVIHRAMLWVEADENWYDRADPDAVGTASDCAELNNCPAPHAGFITRGDANPRYDQQTTLSEPVRPGWIVGTAELRIPFLGHIRLAFSGQVAPSLVAGVGSTAARARRTTSPSSDGPAPSSSSVGRVTHPANPASGTSRAVA